MLLQHAWIAKLREAQEIWKRTLQTTIFKTSSTGGGVNGSSSNNPGGGGGSTSSPTAAESFKSLPTIS